LPSAMAAGSSEVAQAEQRSSTRLLLGRHATLSPFAVSSNTPLHKVLYSHRDSVRLSKVLTKIFAQCLCSQSWFIKSLLSRNEVQSFDGR